MVPPSSPRSSARILPQEIIHMVAGNLIVGENPLLKNGLAACSLTCRCWAELIRPALFNRLTLRTPLEVSQLLEFLMSTLSLRPALNTCIAQVKYEILGEQIPPWVRLHRLSRHVPDVCMELTVGDTRAYSESLVRGGSLLKNFPRTLPPSIFPFHTVRLSNTDFNTPSEFTPIFQNMSKLVEGRLQSSVIRKEATSLIKRTLRVAHPVQLRLYRVTVGSDTFSSQFNLARAMLQLETRLNSDDISWASFVDIIQGLVPTQYRLGKIQLDSVKRGSRSRETHFLSLTAGSEDPGRGIDDDWTEMNVWIDWHMLQVMHVRNVDVFIYGEGSLLDEEGWNNFETQFLREVHHGILYVAVNRLARTLDAVLDGRILTGISQAGRLRLERSLFDRHAARCVTMDEILLTPARYVIGGTTFRLDRYERFYLATCKSAEEKDNYLLELKSTEETGTKLQDDNWQSMGLEKVCGRDNWKTVGDNKRVEEKESKR